MIMERNILIKKNNGIIEIAVVEKGRLAELYHEKPDEMKEGTVIMGTVKNSVLSLNAFFIDIGGDMPGYLPAKNTVTANLKEGMQIPLQVVRCASGDKGMVLSEYLYVSGRYCVMGGGQKTFRVSKKIEKASERERLFVIAEKYKPADKELVIRTNAAGVCEKEIKEDIEKTDKILNGIKEERGKAGSILHRPEDIAATIMRRFNPAEDTVYFNDFDMYNLYFKNHIKRNNTEVKIKLYKKDYDMFDFFNISNKIKEASGKKVLLKCGGTLVFDYTEAMCVIDVNSAKNTKSKKFSDTVFKTNIEAAAEIALQLRVRNIGGIIVIDFIDMDKETAESLDMQFREFLSRDNRKISIGGFTSLGNYELVRSKRGKRLEINYE